ncbi:MAG: UDP-glucose 4-epimerase GalE [Bdellovibrionales bacterium]|nr:UDP-glucose 4-epimerase GalE [Bdellovibrionales bacterium]
MSKIAVIGGAGYIGSVVSHELRDMGHEVTIFDNFSTGHRRFVKDFDVFEGDIASTEDIHRFFSFYQPEALLHFAAKALVSEGEEKAVSYYRNNTLASMQLFLQAIESGCQRFIFSSTAAVYGIPKSTPIDEGVKLDPVNIYGKTKKSTEDFLFALAEKGLCQVISFRYFNAAGASSRYAVGEDHDPETHLIPNVCNAILQGKNLQIFGNDYQTQDGTCVRDFIHVDDLSRAHCLGLSYLLQDKDAKSQAINLGTTTGYSILEIVSQAKRLFGDFNFEYQDRRAGDPDNLVASNAKAKEILGWVPEHSLESILTSAMAWHKKTTSA